jgi:DNA replication protein DnaC
MIVQQEKLTAQLQDLGLTTIVDQLDSLAQQAAAQSWSYTQFLSTLLEGELHHRHTKRAQLNLQFARFPQLKRLSEFDYALQPSIDPRLIEELSTGRYLSEGRNLLLLGPPGVGKTHLAIALGVQVAESGHRVYFTTAMDLARKLTKAVDSNRLQRELNALQQPKLLIIDEMGSAASSPATKPSVIGAKYLQTIPLWPLPPLIDSSIAPP